MLQNVEYHTLPLIKMLNFAGISRLKTSKVKVPTEGKGVPENNLTQFKCSILRENTYEI